MWHVTRARQDRDVDEPAAPLHAQRREHVIICGLSGLALRLVVAFQRSGTEVVVVDEHPDPGRRQVMDQMGIPVIVGAPRKAAVLTSAGAPGARALICVEDSDLNTLETALAARAAWPALRIVSRLANPSVARALAEVTGPGTVLDVATLAAPSLVESCLAGSHHPLDLDGTAFEVTRVVVGRAASLRSLYGALVPVAVVRHGTSDVEVCPGRDVTVAPGDVVALLGTPTELRAQEIGRSDDLDRGAAHRRPGPLRQLGILIRSLFAEVERGFRLTFLALVALVVVSTVILRLAYRQPGPGVHHLPVLTSLYFTVETIATVGYGDYSFASQSSWLKVVGIAIIILGVSALTTLFALLTNQLFGRSLAKALGQRRITGMRGHVVVVGLGSIGIRVAEGVRATGRGVVVIEHDDDNRHLPRARALGLPVITGDASQPSTLDAANTSAAAAVAVLTSDDLTNLDVGLVLRDYLGADAHAEPIVLRIFDRSLSDTVATSFGFRAVRSTTALAAPWFIGAALGLDILSTFYVERELFLVGRLTVAPDGGLAGLSMQELSARIRVIAIRRSDDRATLEHPPRRATRFAPGDQAYLLAPPEELLIVLRRDASPPPRGTPEGVLPAAVAGAEQAAGT